MFVRNKSAAPLDQAIVKALSAVQTSTLGHRRDYGFPRGLSPLTRPVNFVGSAVTVRLPHLDSTALHVAVDSLQPGDVLVVDQSGDTRSCFGGMVSLTAHLRGAVGAVLSGPINDLEEILELGLPVFSSGVSAHTTRLLGIEGEINVPITVGGAVINPGDVIMGDSDGLAVVSREEALELADILREREAGEPGLKHKLATGALLSDCSGAEKLFASREKVVAATA
ncbi:RraA family protein [Rhodococcus sp. NPDC055024]